jgi:chemotaxis protein methyltransferase CheR
MSDFEANGLKTREWAATGLLSEGEYRLFRDLIHEKCGFQFGVEKKSFLESRLRRRMDEVKIKNADEYYKLIKGGAGKSQELLALLDALMICETSFFRNPPQFELFKGSVLTDIVARKVKVSSRSLRVWSAGCSTGQEPYTIVMTLLEALPMPDSWTIRVFASDLSFTALERAQQGVYRAEQLKNIKEGFRQKYFREIPGGYAISDRVKRHVVFDYHNLRHDNGLRNLDVIFCRNVMIYFDAEEQRRLVGRFTTCLVPNGYLLIGHAESLQTLSNRFTMVHANKGIAYRFDG